MPRPRRVGDTVMEMRNSRGYGNACSLRGNQRGNQGGECARGAAAAEARRFRRASANIIYYYYYYYYYYYFYYYYYYYYYHTF